MSYNNQIRIHSIDILRGLAAMFVCLFHFSRGIPNFLPEDNYIRIIGGFGYLGIYIFFIISGFVIPYSLYKGNYTLKKITTFFSKRLLRIEPPYLISILVAILVKYLSSLAPLYRGPAFNIDLVALLLHLGYLCDFFNKDWVNVVYWTLAIEFQFYILIAITYPSFIGTNNKLLFNLFILLITLPLLLDLTIRTNIFHYINYFSIGLVVFRFVVNKSTMLEFCVLIGILLSLIFFKSGIPEAVISLMTILIIIGVKNSNPIFDFFGKISFSLYLLHGVIGSRIINLSVNFTSDIFYRQLVILVALLVSIGCAYLFYILIEKPFLKFSQKITY